MTAMASKNLLMPPSRHEAADAKSVLLHCAGKDERLGPCLPAFCLVSSDEIFVTSMAKVIAGNFDVIEAKSFNHLCNIDGIFRSGKLSKTIVIIDIISLTSEVANEITAFRTKYQDLIFVIMPERTMVDDVIRALYSKVNGYIPKTLTANETIAALEQVLMGLVYLPPIRHEDYMHNGPNHTEMERISERLTPRQHQIIELIAAGKSRKQIAKELSLAENTIKVHAHSAYKIIGVRNKASIILK